MSDGLIDDPADDDRIVLAGEYVLGTLPRDEAERVADDATHDSVLAAEIVNWELRLAPLSRTVPPVSPPSGLWPRIERSAYPGAGVERLRSRPEPSARIGVWKGATAIGFLLAASIAGFALLDRPGMPTPIAVLAPIGAAPAAFVVEARAGQGGISIVPLHPALVPTGRDLELWSLADGATAPHPLGVLPAGGARLAASQLPAGPAKILVSLEPLGGSPTGLPTGPVLYGGTLERPD